MAKTCNCCGVDKDESAFSRNGKSGLHPVCKPCRALKAKQDRLRNVDEARAKDRARYSSNKDSKKLSIRRYYAANADRIRAANRDLYARTSEIRREGAKAYRAANKHKVYEWNGTRRASIRNAVPVWADRVKIRDIYRTAQAITAETGIQHHVDHVIPLAGVNVCGLHVYENLRVVSALENLKKSNQYCAD